MWIRSFVTLTSVLSSLQLYIAVYAVMRGDALRLVYGYDTFGNTCNRKNNPDLGANYSLSGQDTSNMT